MLSAPKTLRGRKRRTGRVEMSGGPGNRKRVDKIDHHGRSIAVFNRCLYDVTFYNCISDLFPTHSLTTQPNESGCRLGKTIHGGSVDLHISMIKTGAGIASIRSVGIVGVVAKDQHGAASSPRPQASIARSRARAVTSCCRNCNRRQFTSAIIGCNCFSKQRWQEGLSDRLLKWFKEGSDARCGALKVLPFLLH